MKLNELSGLMRLSLLISFIYILIVSFFSLDDSDFNYKHFIGIGIIPILLGWGGWWTYKGFKQNKKTTSANQNIIANANDSNSLKAVENKLPKEFKKSEEKINFSSKEEYFKWKATKIKDGTTIKADTSKSTDSQDQKPNNLFPHEKAARLFRALGWIQIIGFIWMSVRIITEKSEASTVDYRIIIVILLFILCSWFVFFLANSLKAHKNWARITGIIYGGLFLVGFPIGTIIGGFILNYLIKLWEVYPIQTLHAPRR